MCRWETCTVTGEHKIKCLVNCFFSLWYSNFSSTLFLLSPNLSFPLTTVLPGHLMSLFRACLAISSLNLHILCSCFPSIFPVFIFLGCAGSDYLSKVDLNLFVLYLTYLCKKFYSKEIFPQYFFQFFIIPNYWCCESMFYALLWSLSNSKKKFVLSKCSTEQYSIHNNLLHHSNFWVWNFGYRKNLYATILNYAQKSTVKNIYTFL